MRQKLLVLGLDGYDPVFGASLMRSGDLPNLQRLQCTSAVIDLEHGAAKRTGLAWEHFATGLRPADANRFSAVEFNKETYRCVQTGTALPPFTRGIDAEVVVFDTPYFDLSQAPKTKGMVSWGAHDPGVGELSRPAKLAQEINRRFGAYPAKRWIYGYSWPSVAATEEMGRSLTHAARVRADISRWLLTEAFPRWELAMIVVSELHSVTEALWHGVDEGHPLAGLPSAEPARRAMLSVYRAVDDLVGELADSQPGAAILAFSIHGMGRNEADLPSMALLPELLYQRAFGKPWLSQPNEPGESGLLVPDEGEDWSETIRRRYTTRHGDGHVMSAPQRESFVSRVIRPQAKKFLAPLRSRRVKMSLGWMPAAWYEDFWPDMEAFALPAFYDGQIRINLTGREANGRVTIDTYDRFLAELEDMLRHCTDPQTDRPIVRSLIRSRRLNPLDIGPTEADLIVVWNGVATAMTHPEFAQIGPLPYRRPGGHTGGPGIAFFRGSDVVAGHCEQRSAFDVVPTILDWVNTEKPALLSGKSFLPTITGRNSHHI